MGIALPFITPVTMKITTFMAYFTTANILGENRTEHLLNTSLSVIAPPSNLANV
jgi:hypothetical protein